MACFPWGRGQGPLPEAPPPASCSRHSGVVTLVWMTCCGKSLMAFVSQPSKLLAKLRMAWVKVPGRHEPRHGETGRPAHQHQLQEETRAQGTWKSEQRRKRGSGAPGTRDQGKAGRSARAALAAVRAARCLHLGHLPVCARGSHRGRLCPRETRGVCRPLWSSQLLAPRSSWHRVGGGRAQPPVVPRTAHSTEERPSDTHRYVCSTRF